MSIFLVNHLLISVFSDLEVELPHNGPRSRRSSPRNCIPTGHTSHPWAQTSQIKRSSTVTARLPPAELMQNSAGLSWWWTDHSWAAQYDQCRYTCICYLEVNTANMCIIYTHISCMHLTRFLVSCPIPKPQVWLEISQILETSWNQQPLIYQLISAWLTITNPLWLSTIKHYWPLLSPMIPH